ncbi:class I adenylate-forming enzyme family protein [Nocardiopsis deserti]|uniref:class I adenylate-forming enzyme family protein n=1 Tax=Nocardiopsis deserti TaxID=2605988 RepID=UPI001680E911|nr:class I adenylate-forming enzyme family protein [Nocardiopsis deserti]
MPDRLSPAELFALLPSSPEVMDRPWTVDWAALTGSPADLLRELVPERTEFSTSGSTGGPRTWSRGRDQLLSEAGMLADLVAESGPEAVVAFAPPKHVYGMLASVLMPALLGVPVWYVPRFAPLPPAGPRRWAVVSIPWTFPILGSRGAWLDGAERLAFLHSTSVLPRSADELMGRLGGRATLTEVFGSTETGGVAHRVWHPVNRPWTLFPDVEFGEGAGAPGEESRLVVRSPRLAAPEGGTAAREHRMDDHVVRLGDRSFGFSGRRTRLVNVNGRRLDLESMEDRLRGIVSCADLACVPVTDPMTGEHFELLIVPGAEGPPSERTLAGAVRAVECRPRAVRVVERIDRSETGKLRRVQSAHVSSEGADA